MHSMISFFLKSHPLPKYTHMHLYQKKVWRDMFPIIPGHIFITRYILYFKLCITCVSSELLKQAYRVPGWLSR